MNTQYLDLCFAVRGEEIDTDHGFLLFSAISELTNVFHDDQSVAIGLISGDKDLARRRRLNRRSSLTVRLPASRVRDAMPLAGKRLLVGRDRVQLGTPNYYPLLPHASLYCRLVVIKGCMDAESFLSSVQTKLDKMGIVGTPSLIAHPAEHAYIRRTVRIHNKKVVGYALRVDGLSDEDSLRLQIEGIGGRRRFGCGMFVPAQEAR